MWQFAFRFSIPQRPPRTEEQEVSKPRSSEPPPTRQSLPVLATALLVCRECLPIDMDSLAHIVDFLDSYMNTFSCNWSVRRACRSGLSRRALEYLAARDLDWVDGYDIGVLAARGGFVHVLQWILGCYPTRIAWDNGLEGSRRCTLMSIAALYGHLPVIQWLHVNRSEGCTYRGMEDAAGNGHLEVVKWLDLNRSEGRTEYAINEAARNGHLWVLEWFHAHRREGVAHFEDTMDTIAASGHRHVLKWFHHNTSESCSPDAIMRAAAGGHLDVVRYLHEHRPHQSSNLRGAAWIAARRGHLGIAEWIYRNHRSGGRVGLASHDTAESLEQKIKRQRLE